MAGNASGKILVVPSMSCMRSTKATRNILFSKILKYIFTKEG